MKLAVLIILLVSSFSITFSQSRYYRIQGMGGLSVASMPDSTLFDRANYFHFGLNNYFEVGEKFNLNASVLFSRKGTRRVSPLIMYQYNMIELDLFHQLEFVEDLALKLGGGVSYLLNAQRAGLNGSSTSGTSRELIFTNETLNLYYELGLISKLQDQLSVYFSWQRNVLFTHKTPLLQEFRFGFTYDIADVRWLKNNNSSE